MIVNLYRGLYKFKVSRKGEKKLVPLFKVYLFSLTCEILFIDNNVTSVFLYVGCTHIIICDIAIVNGGRWGKICVIKYTHGRYVMYELFFLLREIFT